MQPTNEKERANAYGLWLAMFLVTVAITVAAMGMTFKTPSKDIADLRAKQAASDAQSKNISTYVQDLDIALANLNEANANPAAGSEKRSQAKSKVEAINARADADSSEGGKLAIRACAAVQKAVAAAEAASTAGNSQQTIQQLQFQISQLTTQLKDAKDELKDANAKLSAAGMQ